jgi:hypothetical protein
MLRRSLLIHAATLLGPESYTQNSGKRTIRSMLSWNIIQWFVIPIIESKKLYACIWDVEWWLDNWSLNQKIHLCVSSEDVKMSILINTWCYVKSFSCGENDANEILACCSDGFGLIVRWIWVSNGLQRIDYRDYSQTKVCFCEFSTRVLSCQSSLWFSLTPHVENGWCRFNLNS